jgi:hypothetical protein
MTMTGGDIALVIGAVTTLVTAGTASFLAIRSGFKTVREDVQAVHSIVNQASTDAKAYNLLLSNTLRMHGIDVPVDAAVVPPEEPT